MAVPVSSLQSINPGAIIELFTLTLDSTLHGSSTVYRFHNGSNMKTNGDIVWAGNTYEKFPIQCEGFDYGSTGTLPRPTISVSNIFGTITALLQAANQTTIGNDLNGTKLVRIRTLAKFLDAVNFEGNTNPYGTPDPNAEFPQEIYSIDRKSTENRAAVQFELAASFDLANIRIPLRVCTKELFPSIGTFLP